MCESLLRTFDNMTNENFYIFVNRSFLKVLCRTSRNRFNPVTVWKTFLHCFRGFVFIRIFTLTVVQNSQTTEKLGKALNQKNEFSKHERGKGLIQRQHPSNDQLLSTRRGLHSTPNNPAKESGGFLDRTISITCCINWLYSLNEPKGMGMNYREVMS